MSSSVGNPGEVWEEFVDMEKVDRTAHDADDKYPPHHIRNCCGTALTVQVLELSHKSDKNKNVWPGTAGAQSGKYSLNFTVTACRRSQPTW